MCVNSDPSGRERAAAPAGPADGPPGKLAERLDALGRIRAVPGAVVSVYLNTRWSDEHQRERARVFIKNELRLARASAPAAALREDLDWVEAEVSRLIEQSRFPGARGVALFGCRALGLREVLPVRVPFDDAFIIGDRPHLRPLVGGAEEAPPLLVVWVDGRRARLIPVGPGGPADEVVLTADVPGQHRRGGWALLAQSRYRRHTEDHRRRHLDAVADTLNDVAAGDSPRLVLAGEPEVVASLRQRLPGPLAARVAGTVAGAHWEPAAVIVERALEALAAADRHARAAAVDDVLTEAARGGRAVAGLPATLAAVNHGAVHRLYLLERFGVQGAVCPACGTMQAVFSPACPACGGPALARELGEEMVSRVIRDGGTVETVDSHPGLTGQGGVAALLRYPPGG